MVLPGTVDDLEPDRSAPVLPWATLLKRLFHRGVPRYSDAAGCSDLLHPASEDRVRAKPVLSIQAGDLKR